MLIFTRTYSVTLILPLYRPRFVWFGVGIIKTL